MSPSGSTRFGSLRFCTIIVKYHESVQRHNQKTRSQLELDKMARKIQQISLSIIFFSCMTVFVHSAGSQEKPNIICIMLDDATVDETYLDFTQTEQVYFPNIRALASNGIRFTNAHATTPLCGPSRAAFYRGQYAHHVDVRVNKPEALQSQSFPGGFQKYKAQGFTNDDLGTWMKDAGYKTMLVGKYLHSGYTGETVPGYDQMYVSLGSKYFDTLRSINGSREKLASGEYRTTVEANDILDLIDAHLPQRKNNGTPFFLMWTPFAPHDGPMGDPNGIVEEKYKNLWSNKKVPKDQDYNEPQNADKPAIYHRLERMSQTKRIAGNEIYRDRLRALKSADDQIGRIVSKLRDENELDNTYIVVLSDNGYQVGHHRSFGKMDPFDRVTNIPMIVSGPNVANNKVSDHLLSHIDVTATLLDFAGAPPKTFFDGKSFAPLLEDPDSVPDEDWQDAILIENYQIKLHQTPRIADFIQLQMSYLSVRKHHEIYNEWSTGEKEYYDLNTDPRQMENAYDDLTDAEKDVFANLLQVVRDPLAKPKTYISKPFFGFTSRPMNIKGLAEGDSVDKVRLIIKSLDRNKFWNGTGWQNASVQILADVKSEDGLLTNWEYNLPLVFADNNSKIRVTARAVDKLNRISSNTPVVVATVDGTRPNGRIKSPRADAVVDKDKTITISGVASDNAGIHSVRLSIRNLDNSRHWNGTNWQNERKDIVIETNQEKLKRFNWSYQFKVPGKAKIRVTALTVDHVNNRDLSPSAINFEAK